MLPTLRKEASLFPVFKLRDGIEHLFEDFFSGEKGLAPFWSNGQHVPALDVRETEDAILVDAELPGLTREEIQVKVEEGALMISAERKERKDEKTKNVHRQERYYGRMERTLALPSSVDGTKVEALYKDGVLHVTLPKKPSAKAKTVTVKVN